MLIVLIMALVGDLILLPALLAGPLGKYFGKERPQSENLEVESFEVEPKLRLIGDQAAESMPEVILPPGTDLAKNIRRLE